MPEFEGDTQLFGRWYAPLAPDGYLWLALDRSGTSGLYDRLYIDSNGNGHLNDESVAFGVGMNVRSAHFGPLCVVFLTEHGLIAYHLRFIFFGQEEINTLSAYSSGWREGTIAIGNKQTRCTLIDYNVNGVFNDKPRNLDFDECDLIQLGRQGTGQVELVGTYLKVEDTLYEMDVAPDGAYIKLVEAKDVSFGTVRLPEEVTEFTAGGENGSFTFQPVEDAVHLPVGKYQINHWTIARSDGDGVRWELQGVGFRDKGYFSVTERGETEIVVGEPVVLSAVVTEQNSMYTFRRPRLTGRHDEMIMITRNGQRTRPPRLRIKNKDGTYDRVFSFEYG